MKENDHDGNKRPNNLRFILSYNKFENTHFYNFLYKEMEKPKRPKRNCVNDTKKSLKIIAPIGVGNKLCQKVSQASDN